MKPKIIVNQNYIYIEGKDNLEVEEVKVYDILGRKVAEMKSGGKIKIDASGLYVIIVKIKNDNKIITLKEKLLIVK